MLESFELLGSLVPLTSAARMFLLTFAAGLPVLSGVAIAPFTPLRLPLVLGTPHREN